MPEFITSLPENFTLEFELGCDKKQSGYMYVKLAALNNLTKIPRYIGHYEDVVTCSFDPGNYSYSAYKAGISNNGSTTQFTESKNFVKISIWRQKTRLRVYMNAEKVVDVPRAFSNDLNYNAVLFETYNVSPPHQYLFSNIRLAVGAPGTRNRLITEGKFVTRGILFDVARAEVKPESYGVLKNVAAVLNENPEVRVRIVGHTDADGDDNSNLNLSKQRAEAVKNSLVQDFGIELSRFETDGKGESQPVDKNTTPEGKANNRRVKFIKL